MICVGAFTYEFSTTWYGDMTVVKDSSVVRAAKGGVSGDVASLATDGVSGDGSLLIPRTKGWALTRLYTRFCTHTPLVHMDL